MINAPIFSHTSDIDWASDYCIGDFLELLSNFGIKPTIFATRKSRLFDNFNRKIFDTKYNVACYLY